MRPDAEVPPQEAGTDPMTPRLACITRRRRDTASTFIMELESPDGASLPAFLPGQFNMVYVFGVGEVPLSIAGSSAKQLLHTARTVGLVTRAMWRLRPGDYVGVRGPFGTAWPLDEAAGKDVILIAGGIGIAAMHSAVLALAARRDAYNRIALLYGARTPGETLYHRAMERWRRSELTVRLTVDRAPAGCGWTGGVGVVTSLIPRTAFDPLNCVAMICGPEVMMRFTVLELKKRGVPETCIFLSMERNMKCAIGFCGHCQFGPEFVCKDGPIFRYDRIRKWLEIPEL